MAKKIVAIEVQIEGNKQLTQLQGNLENTQRQLKSLRNAEKRGIITAKEAVNERARLNVQLKANRNALIDQQNAILKNNNALKKNSGFVAGVRKGISQYATSMFGLTAAIAGVTAIVGGAVKIFKDFEAANSKLEAVLGATENQMEKLSTQAKNLGSTTAFTASQVTELQTEYAKLGFPTEEILNMTEATLNGAAALGSELGEQAALTGATLKQFGLDSTDAARVNDVLAKSASSSALDFSKLSTALPIVGATAKTAGVDLERTTALLGTLSDRGIDASTAATSLRNIFLELSKKGITYNEAMEKINNATDKNKVAMDLFGKRAATAGIILSETEGNVTDLTEALKKSDGAAKAMADTMLDNLAGDITKAGSAWEGFILSLEDGEGFFSKLMRGFTQSITEFLGGLTELNEFDWSSLFVENSTTNERALLSLSESVLKIVNPAMGEAAATINEKLNSSLVEADEKLKALNEEQLRSKFVIEEQTKLYVAEGLSIDEIKKKFENQLISLRKLNDEKLKTTETTREETETEKELTDEEKELTDEEKAAINEKARKRAEAEAKAKKDALDRIKETEVEDEDEDFMFLIDNEIAKNEALKAERDRAREEERQAQEEFTNAQIDSNEREFENEKTLNRLRFEQNQQRLAAAAGLFNSLSGLAKEGSAAQKGLATTGAIINTYAGAAAALAPPPIGGGPIVGPLIAAATIANGLAQVARINGVKFEEGGLINGASHSQGGVPFTVNGVGGFEAEGGEYIINKRSTAMFRPLIESINEAGRTGSMNNKYFANGGATPRVTGVTAQQQTLMATTDTMEMFSSNIIDGINNKEVINVATNTSDVATEVFNIQSEATFGS